MLNGKIVTLRPFEAGDLEQFYAYQTDFSNRGIFIGRHFRKWAEIQDDFAKHGFWTDESGMLAVINNETARLSGSIGWFATVQYMDEIEIGYSMYDTTVRSRGGMTEALHLITRFLFDSRPYRHRYVNRIRLCIATGNIASRRVAEKAGYTHELTQRGATVSLGKRLDLELYSFLRVELAKTG